MFSNKWNEKDQKIFVNNLGNTDFDFDLGSRVYTSRLIGSIPDLVMHGGGNTSCKSIKKDTFGKDINVISVKGSGWDLGTIEAEGLPSIKLEPLLKLRTLDKLTDEEMVNQQRSNLLKSNSPNPSVETLLHAFLPHKFIDHTHATPFLILANLPNYKEIVDEIFGSKLAIVPYIMPGFDLAKCAANIFDSNKNCEGLLLVNHGHFTWGRTAKESYDKVIDQTNKVDSWIQKKVKKKKYVVKKIDYSLNFNKLNLLAKIRGNIQKNSIEYNFNPTFDIRIDEEINNFLFRKDLLYLSKRGVASPDHVIRIKGNPIILSQTIGQKELNNKLDQYRKEYLKYFKKNQKISLNKLTMLNPNPNVIWAPGIGIIGIGGDKSGASLVADIAVQNIKVINSGENLGGYFPISEKDQFDIEYWSLEQAKIQKITPSTIKGKTVIITGAGGVIGRETAKLFNGNGANVFLVDKDIESLKKTYSLMNKNSFYLLSNLTNSNSAEEIVYSCLQNFGGIDILISNAGVAFESSILDLDIKQLKESFELNFFAHFNISKEVSKIFINQGIGGKILFNVSKQAVNPGKNFGSYGLPKSTLMFLLKQMALELGKYNISVNGINADKIRSGILTSDMIKKRSKSRGIDEKKYMTGNLLALEVEAKHVAEGFLSLSKTERTSAHILTVDGGNIEASLR
ncbi:bifunctional aldolase/short-chain dehydrogenase [Pseudomonadota bacterium]|nr:bifunctional aldolase/short-chain dehydrogenase [Alphaproteobacteria bacterium]MDC1356819.1 bifunctional aldolase/short-chain dehydrogenase [Pseudomonadota bacterium]